MNNVETILTNEIKRNTVLVEGDYMSGIPAK